jgi:sporulation protein YlmC with PRC-barrel domain
MRKALPAVLVAFGFLLAFAGLQIVLGEPADVNSPANVNPGVMQEGQMHVGNVQLLQASRLIGMEVRNDSQEKLGKIEDLAIDQNTGRVRYAVLSFGGVMGIGGKLLPMPWIALKTVSKAATTEGATTEMFCVLNVDKDALQKAPSFDKGQWPDFNNEKWVVTINDFYRPYIARQHGGATTR